MAAAETTLRMAGVVKRFGSVTALGGVDLDVRRGEIHGLLGENGAGKSTLMNVLYGLLAPDAGTILIDGEPVRMSSPQVAMRHGVGMVHQHFRLVPTLTVAENMVLGERRPFLLRKRHLRATAARLEELHQRYGLGIDPWAKISQLSIGEQQRVEILRALYRNAHILVLDEPTATLTPVESEQLLPKLRALADEGAAIVFITHHLDDVMRWADRITVLRRGENVATLAPAETSANELARLMVGRDVALAKVATGERFHAPRSAEQRVEAAAPDGGPRVVLEVEGLGALSDRGTPALEDVSLTVCAGEIVAVAGVEGNGQAELEQILFGLREPTRGNVRLGGEDITRATPAQRLDRRLGLIPSDRYRRGMVRPLSVAENLVLDRIDQPPFGSRFAVRRRAINQRAAELIDTFSIHVSGPEQLAGTLSGGNAQRVVLARVFSRELRCLIAAQPTRGLDVGAIEFVWEQLDAARRQGVAVLLISTDLDEVAALADRCCVIYRGRLLAQWPRAELDRERIGLAMGGVVGRAGADSDAIRTGASS
jgi:simple sugar transport system ATP-binding protein